MSPSPNRARLVIERPGEPGLYQLSEIIGWKIIGTVRANGETGALIRHIHTDTYARANAGVKFSLDQRKVVAALGLNAKRLDGGKRINVYLDEATVARARELGDGNMSEGIRKALALSAET